MNSQALPERKDDAVDWRQVLPSFTATGFVELAARFSESRARVERLANQPLHERVLRPFRTAEIEDISGLNERQIRAWRKAHLDELEHKDAKNGYPMTLAEIHRMMADHDALPRRPEGRRAMRMGVVNFKGGSTKSSTTLHLSIFLAMRGWRTLVIDADPQGTLTTLFSFDPDSIDEALTLAPVFRSVSDRDLFTSVKLSPLPTHIDGLHFVPACLDMIGADIQIANAFVNRGQAVSKFYEIVSRAISTVEDDYDIILIDGAPAFSFAALATVWAMDGLIVPMPPEAPDYSATGSFFSMIGEALETVCARAGQEDRVWAPAVVVHNRVKASQSSEVFRRLSRHVLGAAQLEQFIPDAKVIPSALALLRSVYEVNSTDVDSRALRKARDAYNNFGREVQRLIEGAWSSGIAMKEATS